MKGGKRPNAGRKPGSKSRLKSEIAAAAESKLNDILKGRVCPLEHMLRVMSDEKKDDSLRLEAAKSAAVYIHRKQPQDVNVGGTDVPLAVQILVPTLPTDDAQGA